MDAIESRLHLKSPMKVIHAAVSRSLMRPKATSPSLPASHSSQTQRKQGSSGGENAKWNTGSGCVGLLLVHLLLSGLYHGCETGRRLLSFFWESQVREFHHWPASCSWWSFSVQLSFDASANVVIFNKGSPFRPLVSQTLKVLDLINLLLFLTVFRQTVLPPGSKRILPPVCVTSSVLRFVAGRF